MAEESGKKPRAILIKHHKKENFAEEDYKTVNDEQTSSESAEKRTAVKESGAPAIKSVKKSSAAKSAAGAGNKDGKTQTERINHKEKKEKKKIIIKKSDKESESSTPKLPGTVKEPAGELNVNQKEKQKKDNKKVVVILKKKRQHEKEPEQKNAAPKDDGKEKKPPTVVASETDNTPKQKNEKPPVKAAPAPVEHELPKQDKAGVGANEQKAPAAGRPAGEKPRKRIIQINKERRQLRTEAIHRDKPTAGGPITANRGQRTEDRKPKSGDNNRQGGGFKRNTTARHGFNPTSAGGYGQKNGYSGGKDTQPLGSGDDNKNRGSNKKQFKVKKKQEYQKNRNQERNFQINKKRSVALTNPVPKEIKIMDSVMVSDLAKKMNLKSSEVISKLMSIGIMVSLNQQIDAETAEIVAAEYGCNVTRVSLYDETIIEQEEVVEAEKKLRPPIVTVMGHVDHGKTKLLDTIRKTNIVSGEHGGITQHIGAYHVEVEDGKNIVFLDTPGHEAFTLMRARGAQITDVVILVVAANDGVMPQTREAINHAKEAGVPIIVAINKIDLPDSNIDKIMSQLSEHDLTPEEWGGSTIVCQVSALTGEGVDNLLDSVLVVAELLELKASYNSRATATVIESRVDMGRGIVSTVIVQEGTLRVGDPFVAGIYAGKVRAMFDDTGRKVSEATPSIPVEVVGFDGSPTAGAPFQTTDSERTSRQISNKRQELERHGEARGKNKISLDAILRNREDEEISDLKVIIKGDVHGSIEALRSSLEKLSNSETHLIVIHSSVGAIVENDVNLAIASNAIIIGFHVRPTVKAQTLADENKVEIRKYNVIYDVIVDIRSAMEGMLAPELQEAIIGGATIKELFKVPKIGLVAGVIIKEGKVTRNASARVYRDGVEIYTSKLTSLKRYKDDVKEVESGVECGIGLEDNNDIKVGDQLEFFQINEVKRTLQEV